MQVVVSGTTDCTPQLGRTCGRPRGKGLDLHLPEISDHRVREALARLTPHHCIGYTLLCCVHTEGCLALRCSNTLKCTGLNQFLLLSEHLHTCFQITQAALCSIRSALSSDTALHLLDQKSCGLVGLTLQIVGRLRGEHGPGLGDGGVRLRLRQPVLGEDSTRLCGQGALLPTFHGCFSVSPGHVH